MKKRGNKLNSRPRLYASSPTPRNRSGVISEYLPWLLIGMVILAVIMISIFLLKGKGFEFIDKIKEIFGGR